MWRWCRTERRPWLRGGGGECGTQTEFVSMGACCSTERAHEHTLGGGASTTRAHIARTKETWARTQIISLRDANLKVSRVTSILAEPRVQSIHPQVPTQSIIHPQPPVNSPSSELVAVGFGATRSLQPPSACVRRSSPRRRWNSATPSRISTPQTTPSCAPLRRLCGLDGGRSDTDPANLPPPLP